MTLTELLARIRGYLETNPGSPLMEIIEVLQLPYRVARFDTRNCLACTIQGYDIILINNIAEEREKCILQLVLAYSKYQYLSTIL